MAWRNVLAIYLTPVEVCLKSRCVSQVIVGQRVMRTFLLAHALRRRAECESLSLKGCCDPYEQKQINIDDDVLIARQTDERRRTCSVARSQQALHPLSDGAWTFAQDFT